MPAGLKRPLIVVCSLAFVGMTVGILLLGSPLAPVGDEHELIQRLSEFARP